MSGNFTVRLLIPEDLRSAENLMVIHIADDGAVTAVDATRDGNYMEFTVNGFSVYAVVEVTEDVPEGGNWWIYVLIAVAVIIIVIVIILLLRRKKDEGDGEPAPEEEKAEEPAEEPAQEEEETQEAQEEPAAESEEPAPEEPEEEPEEPDEPDGAALAAAPTRRSGKCTTGVITPVWRRRTTKSRTTTTKSATGSFLIGR